MSSNPEEHSNSGIQAVPQLPSTDEKHLEGGEQRLVDQEKHLGLPADTLTGVNKDGQIVDAHNSAGLAIIEQRQAIPTTGKRLVTSKWEYWT